MEKCLAKNGKKESSESGISLITLTVTIIVMIILAAIVIWNGSTLPDQASKANYLLEISQIQELIKMKRNDNMQYKDKNYGFKSIEIVNAPDSLESISKDKKEAYVIDLSYIGAETSTTGHGYKDLDYENGKVEFGVSDVYVYDKNGVVFYAKGIIDGENNMIYQVESSNNAQ